MPDKTFICHSSLDHTFVGLLAKRLRTDGVDVWVDDWEIKVGDSITQKITEGLEDSSFFITILSNNSIKSDWVKRELNSSLMRQISKKDIKILPVLLDLEPENLSPLLLDIYAVRFSRMIIDDMEYSKLLSTIKEKQKADSLHQYQDVFFETVEHIDIILEKGKPTRPEVEFILRIIQEDQYNNYFFKKVNLANWFDILKNEGYFSPEKVPSPKQADKEGYFMIPQWNVLPYLERVSQKVNVPGNEKYIDDLLVIIREVSSYKDSMERHIDNYRTWHYFVKILLNIPSDKISLDIIELSPVWLDSKFDTTLQGSEIVTKLLPKFLTDNPKDIEKAQKIIESITAIKTSPLSKERAELLGKEQEARLVVGPFWLKESFGKHSNIIGEKCSKRVIDDLANKVKTLLEQEEDETYKSFYEELEYDTDDPTEMLTFILKRVLIAKAKNDVATTKEILREFLKDRYLYFPKTAIYIIGQNIENYSELFWEVLDADGGDFILTSRHFGDEIKHLLQNLKDLTDDQKNKLKVKIEQVAKRHTPDEDAERYIALYKQKIYGALSHDPFFNGLYEETKKITNIDVELRPAIGRVEIRSGPGSSPLTKEEILVMANRKLAEFLSTFKAKDFWSGGPTVGGLSDTLKEVAKEQPEKFVSDLLPFLNTAYLYIYDILFGIKDAWNNKKLIEWGKLFNFIEQYINRDEFWQDKFIIADDDWHASHKWVAGMVTELIQDGSRDDSWAFPEEHFDKAEKIILLLLDGLKAEDDKEIRDYVTYTLNTALGKAITALILLTLRIARINNKKGNKGEVKWSPEIKERYEKILGNKIIEGFTCLGQYLPNFYYLDKAWAKERIELLESEKGNKYWEAFMDGYFSIGKVYDDLYGLMKPHCQYGLSYDFKEHHNMELLIQYICIQYLRDHEKLEDPGSLFKTIIDAWSPEQIKEVISFFWMQRDFITESSEENERMKGKIIGFWKHLYEKYIGKDDSSLTQEDKQVLSSASRLAVILPQVDAESYKWLMLSAPYVNEDFNASFFIEYLNELKDKGNRDETAKYIGDIYLKMLDKFTPDYDQEHIRSIVEFLYNAGATDSANRICNIYGSRGHEFLRDIYERHSDRTQ